MADLHLTLEGLEAWNRAVDDWIASAQSATLSGLEEGVEELRSAIQRNLARHEYPPASQPGEPPAMRTGELFGSVEVGDPFDDGDGMYEIRAWPSTVYARIQELGGWAGRDHRSHLPARPYVEPAVEDATDEFASIMMQAWAGANGG